MHTWTLKSDSYPLYNPPDTKSKLNTLSRLTNNTDLNSDDIFYKDYSTSHNAVSAEMHAVEDCNCTTRADAAECEGEC